MKSRLATIVTVMALVGGTGGAIAVAGSGAGNNGQGSAANGQYRPGKGCGDKNHQHNRKGCPKPPHHKPGLKQKHHGSTGKSHHKNTHHKHTHHKKTKSHKHGKSKHS